MTITLKTFIYRKNKLNVKALAVEKCKGWTTDRSNPFIYGYIFLQCGEKTVLSNLQLERVNEVWGDLCRCILDVQSGHSAEFLMESLFPAVMSFRFELRDKKKNCQFGVFQNGIPLQTVTASRNAVIKAFASESLFFWNNITKVYRHPSLVFSAGEQIALASECLKRMSNERRTEVPDTSSSS